MKYAVVESGGKQYLTREGEVIEVDRLSIAEGKSVSLKNVLLLVDDGEIRVGDPYVKGAVVKGKVVGEVKGSKIVVFKYIPKERYRRKRGHRQRYTRIAVQSISAGAAGKTAEADKAEEAPKATRRRTTKAKAEEAPKAAAKARTTKPKTDKPAATRKASEKPKPKATRTTSSAKKASTRASKAQGSSKKTSARKSSTGSKTKKDEG